MVSTAAIALLVQRKGKCPHSILPSLPQRLVGGQSPLEISYGKMKQQVLCAMDVRAGKAINTLVRNSSAPLIFDVIKVLDAAKEVIEGDKGVAGEDRQALG